MAKSITFYVSAHECSECKELFTRPEWRQEFYKKCDEFGDYNVWDSVFLCYDCYFRVHDFETTKDEYLQNRIPPLTKKLVHGYECASCQGRVTAHEWYRQQEEIDNPECEDICYQCYEYGHEERNYAKL